VKASQFDSSSELINSTRQVSEATAPSGILVLESNPEVLEIWRRELGSLGYRPFVTADREEARRVLQSEHPAFLFCDVVEIFRNGRCILSSLLDLDRALPVIILTNLFTVEMAAEALRQGALFYVLRPITPDNLRLATEHGLARRKEKLLMPALERRQRWICGEIIVGTSDAVQEVLELAGRIAPSDANIVISGEFGTGKELFARVIHTSSDRADEVFLAVDCASLPENLLEAELFGYEKGAFTGAIRTKPGLMELANGGYSVFRRNRGASYKPSTKAPPSAPGASTSPAAWNEDYRL